MILTRECGAELEYELEESSDQVVVDLFAVGSNPMDDCGSFAEGELTDPLGDRELIDATTGRAIPVTDISSSLAP